MMRFSSRTIIMLIIFLQFCLIRSFHCQTLFGSSLSRFKPSTLASNAQDKPIHSNQRRINLFQEPDNESPEEVIQGAIGVKSLTKYLLPVALIGGVALFSAFSHNIDVSQFLTASVKKIEELGPYGYLYFALVYIAAELLAIPVFPLTASSGYLFGLLPGTLLVVGCATIAASVSFFTGRTFLRDWAQHYIQKSEIWRLADKAIAKEGFKFVLLLRLSPLLPFAVANYLYAVTSVDFWSFIAATFLGFLPGSFGFVYFGNAGKELFSDHQGMPWYMYAAIGAGIVLLGKTFTTIAMNAVNEIKKEEEELTVSQKPKEK